MATTSVAEACLVGTKPGERLFHPRDHLIVAVSCSFQSSSILWSRRVEVHPEYNTRGHDARRTHQALPRKHANGAAQGPLTHTATRFTFFQRRHKHVYLRASRMVVPSIIKAIIHIFNISNLKPRGQIAQTSSPQHPSQQ